jgi:hypothetical protein
MPICLNMYVPSPHDIMSEMLEFQVPSPHLPRMDPRCCLKYIKALHFFPPAFQRLVSNFCQGVV